MNKQSNKILDQKGNTGKLDTVVIKPCYYFKNDYHAGGFKKNSYNFYIQVYDQDKKCIRDNSLADHAFNQTWAKTRSQMNKAEKRCLKAGLIRIY